MAALWLLSALATFRATRLVVADRFPGQPLRTWVTARWGDESWQAYLVECPWCMGVWVSAGVTASTVLVRDVPVPVWWWLSLAAAVGVLSAALRVVELAAEWLDVMTPRRQGRGR